MTIEIYEAADGFRWRLKAANHRIIAESGEAYRTRYGVKRALLALQYGRINLVPVVEVKA